MSKKAIPKIVQDDPWLAPYEEDIRNRIERFDQMLKEIERDSNLINFAGAYRELGIHFRKKDRGWYYREWAPEAFSLSLTGEFNNWDRESHKLTKMKDGVWEIFIPEEDLEEGSLVKVHVVAKNGAHDRIPAYIFRVIQDRVTHDFCGQVWNLDKEFNWSDHNFDLRNAVGAPIIYETHVGMAQEKEAVGGFNEFTELILPRIVDLGYNTIQLMAIQEHPYYGSFGYHVSNFFCVSSRFGTPDEFRKLVDTAHNMGVAVIIDLVHSHAVKNFAEGLNDFDGSGHQYFHEGGRGYHNQWDSKLFESH